MARYAAIHARYEPVFHSLEGDKALASVARHTGDETVTRIHARLVTATLPPRQLDPVIRLLLETVNHTLDVSGILRSTESTAYPGDRVELALTDVLHRTLFGLDLDVNVHAPDGPPPPELAFGPELVELLRDDGTTGSDGSGNAALVALLAAGRDVFVERGYQATRVDDLVSAAGVSHGAFYRYFRNKEELARILTVRGVRAVGTVVTEIPALFTLRASTGKGVMRRWLRRYHAEHVHQAAMLPRVDRRRAGRPGDPGRVRAVARLGPTTDVAVPGSAGLRRCRHRSRGHGGAARGLRRAPAIGRRDRRRRAHHRAGAVRSRAFRKEHRVSGSEFDAVDFFRAKSLYQDPYPYYEYLRDQGPVWREPHHGVVMVTGYQEAMSVYRDSATFSSCNTVSGPFPGFPVPLVGDDVSALIEEYRDELPFSDQLPTFDPPRHTEHRGLLMRLITPKRLKENEEFMWRLADLQIDEFLARGECEFIHDYANPFTLLVIADLLGVPEADHASFREELQGKERPTRQRGKAGAAMAHKPLEFLYERFTAYIEECRREPRDDVMTELATATFPDGSLPEINDVMLIAGNLFAAGQETTARLLGQMLRLVAERPELQDLLRDDRSRIASLVEEALRLESPIQGEFRLSRVPATVGGVDLPAGTTLMLVNGAANRDPREFEHPDELRLDRVNGRQHLGFGFGIHTCAGAPLARGGGLRDLRARPRPLGRHHDLGIRARPEPGPGATSTRPIYMLRGLEQLQVEFTPLTPPATRT